MKRQTVQVEKPYEWNEYDHNSEKTNTFMIHYHEDFPWPFRWHYHTDHYEILLHEKLPGKYMVGDSAGELLEGNVFFLAPGLAHSFFHVERLRETAACSRIRFSKVTLERLRLAIPEFCDFTQLFIDAKFGILYQGGEYDQVRKIFANLNRMKNHPTVDGFSLFLDCLSFFKNYPGKLLSSQEGRFSGKSEKNDRINAVCEYLIANYKNPISLEDIASVVHTSVSNLCSFFRKKTGMTIVQYLNTLKISRACELLQDGQYSILDIAQESGYANLSHFNRQFLKVKGVTPRVYRKQLENDL